MQILVKDVNDESPYFDRTVYDGLVSEDAGVGTKVDVRSMALCVLSSLI